MSENKIKNILVLGTSGVETAQFVKLFGAYLNYDSYKEAVKWQPKLSENESVIEITSSSMLIRNQKINFINTLSLDVYSNKQIISILLYFMQKQQITAIIFLTNTTEEPEHVLECKSRLLSKLKEFDVNNILYIFALNNEFYKYAQFMSHTFRQERSQFYFEEDKYYKISNDNWRQSRNFCKSVYNYIMGEDNTNGLQDIYIQTKIPKKSALKLVDDLLELLIGIYISVEYCTLSYDGKKYHEFYIEDYNKNVTTCYGNNCIEWTKHKDDNKLKWKIPKICHGPCNCFEFYADGRCTMFDTSDKTCFKCKCGVDSHSSFFFIYNQYEHSKYITTFEKCIAINNLATFSLYKKQNQETYNFENICNNLLDMDDATHQEILNNFNKDFNEEVQKLENKIITEENILTCLNEFDKISNAAEIIPHFMDEMFPKDIQLEIIPEGNESNKGIDMKREMELLNKEVAELQQKLKNSEDLNSKLIQDMQLLSQQRKTRQNEEEVKGN